MRASRAMPQSSSPRSVRDVSRIEMTHEQDETVEVTCIDKGIHDQVQVKDNNEDKSSVVKGRGMAPGVSNAGGSKGRGPVDVPHSASPV